MEFAYFIINSHLQPFFYFSLNNLYCLKINNFNVCLSSYDNPNYM